MCYVGEAILVYMVVKRSTFNQMVQTSNMCYVDDDLNWQRDLGFKVQGDKPTPQHHWYVNYIAVFKKIILQWISHKHFFPFVFGDFFANKRGEKGGQLKAKEMDERGSYVFGDKQK